MSELPPGRANWLDTVLSPNHHFGDDMEGELRLAREELRNLRELCDGLVARRVDLMHERDALKAEVERLRRLVYDAYSEGAADAVRRSPQFLDRPAGDRWDVSRAKTALEGKP